MLTHTLNLCSAFNPFKCSHTVVNTHREHTPVAAGNQCCGGWGAVGGLVPCSRVSPQSWYWKRRERWLFTITNPPTIPARPETRSHDLSVTSPPFYPLGHDWWSTVCAWKQSKTILNKYVRGFGCERTTEDGLFFAIEKDIKYKKHIYIRYSLFKFIQIDRLFALQDFNWWTGLLKDYCDLFISCLDSHPDSTHSLIFTWELNF